jgi:DNA-binding HxlR family transcriptional regulator
MCPSPLHPDTARYDTASHDTARHDTERHDIAQPDTLSQRLDKGDLFAQPCPSRDILKHVCSRWGVLCLLSLRQGTHRFSELRRKIGGVSEKMLAQSLQALADDGFVLRVSYPVVPPFVEYSLTPLGEEVAEHVATLANWIEVNLPRVLEARTHMSTP